MLFLESPTFSHRVLTHFLSLSSNPISSWNELLSALCCEGLCLHLACSPLMLPFLFYSSLDRFLSHKETAGCSRAQVLFWYFQVLCNSGDSVSSLLNQQMEGMAAAKADAPPWPLMLKLISLSDGGTETGKVLLPASTWGRWRCYMARGMQMWVLWHWHLALWSPSTGALLHFSDACLPSLSSPQETSI